MNWPGDRYAYNKKVGHTKPIIKQIVILLSIRACRGVKPKNATRELWWDKTIKNKVKMESIGLYMKCDEIADKIKIKLKEKMNRMLKTTPNYQQ